MGHIGKIFRNPISHKPILICKILIRVKFHFLDGKVGGKLDEKIKKNAVDEKIKKSVRVVSLPAPIFFAPCATAFFKIQ